MLQKFSLLSVNQLGAKIKLMEVWKIVNCPDYPLRLEPYRNPDSERRHDLRPQLNKIFNDNCRLKRSEQSFNVDAARLWNLAPMDIKNATTLNRAKTFIVNYAPNLILT